MVSLGFSSKAIIFPVRVLSKICICGRRRTLVLRLRWRVDSREDEALLIRGNAFLVLDLGLDVVDGVRGLDLERDGLARERLNEDLHVEREGE